MEQNSKKYSIPPNKYRYEPGGGTLELKQTCTAPIHQKMFASVSVKVTKE
jgi:hypothetical protein